MITKISDREQRHLWDSERLAERRAQRMLFPSGEQNESVPILTVKQNVMVVART